MKENKDTADAFVRTTASYGSTFLHEKTISRPIVLRSATIANNALLLLAPAVGGVVCVILQLIEPHSGLKVCRIKWSQCTVKIINRLI